MQKVLSVRTAERGSVSQTLLVSAIGAATLLDISERLFHQLRHTPEFPKPVSLGGKRSTRWRVADLHAYVEALPVSTPVDEPAQLRGARAGLARTGHGAGA